MHETRVIPFTLLDHWRLAMYERYIREINNHLQALPQVRRERDLTLLQGWRDLKREFLDRQLRKAALR